MASLLTKPESEKILKTFYRNVRPWGFWKPIHEKVISDTPNFRQNKAFKRDMVNVAVGILWQMTLVLIPVYLVIRKLSGLWISILLLGASSIFLKKNWYNKLEENESL